MPTAGGRRCARPALRIAAWGTICFAVLVTPVRAATVQHFNAIMIYASNEPAPPDRRLQPVEQKLRSVFGFQFYRLVGQGSVSMPAPGSGTINLGGGYSLNIRTSEPSGGRVMAEVTWGQGGRVLLSTKTHIGKAPTVLGGASHRQGKLIVTLTAR